MQTQDIKRRIRSVKSTQQITRAMKFVSAAKLRKAQAGMLGMRPYADAVDGLVVHIAHDLVGDEHPLLHPHKTVKRVAYVLIAGDRGLAGGFNSNLFKAVTEYIGAKKDIEPVFIAIGKETIRYLRKSEHRVLLTYHDVFEKLSYIMAGDICDRLVAQASSSQEPDNIDEAYVVYNEFASMLTQRPVIRKLLPVTVGELLHKDGESSKSKSLKLGDADGILEEIVLDETPDAIFDAAEAEEELMAKQGEMEATEKKVPVRPIYELLPDTKTALEKLISRRMATEIYRGMLESYAAELAARMTAMDNATNNAEEMVANLTLDLNRARQYGITTELLDIIGGANALG